MSQLVGDRLAYYMQQWGMDPDDPPQRRCAQHWMAIVDTHRYYTTAIFVAYTYNGIRGILSISTSGGNFASPGDDVM